MEKSNYFVEQRLLDALEKLRAKPEQFDLTLIDLNLPPIPPELQKNIKKLKMRGYTLNQGQTLGVWLDEHQPNTKYAYFTAYPIAFDTRGDVPKQEEIAVLSKSDTEQCFEKVAKFLSPK